MLFEVFIEPPTNGSVILSKLLQPENDPASIFVTLLGTVILVRQESPLNIQGVILVMPSGISNWLTRVWLRYRLLA